MNGELALAYVGEYSKHNPNVPHGYGAMLYHDHGGLYEGRFVNGKRHGRGKLVIGDDETKRHRRSDARRLPVNGRMMRSMDSRISLRTAKE